MYFCVFHALATTASSEFACQAWCGNSMNPFPSTCTSRPSNCGGCSACTATHDRTHLPLVYLHFHKAAGTTACDEFKRGSLRTKSFKSEGGRYGNCNCPPEFLDALRAADGAKVTSFMRQHGVDVCFVEELQHWPAPASLMQLRRSVRLATTQRETWQRLVSNYERDSERIT